MKQIVSAYMLPIVRMRLNLTNEINSQNIVVNRVYFPSSIQSVKFFESMYAFQLLHTYLLLDLIMIWTPSKSKVCPVVFCTY